MVFRKIAAFLLLLLIPCSLLVAQRTETNKIQFKVDSIISSYHSSGVFNGSVLVVKHAKELFHKSYGYADSEKKELLTPNHQFGIGSIYKEFPAVMTMILHENGELKLDDKVNQFLPHLPPWAQSITVLDLLKYTGGLPNIDWNKYFSNSLVVTEDRLMEDLMQIKELEFTPGSGYLYTNYSPFLLIKIIEKITGSNFPSIVQEELFNSSGMDNSQFKSQYPYKNTEMMALPFSANYESDSYDIMFPSMLLTTTTSDLHSWFSRLNSHEIIDKTSLNLLAQAANLDIDNMQAPLGNCEIKDGEITEHIHHGGMGNYEGLVTRNNFDGWTIILLTNQKNKNLFEITENIKTVIRD